MPNIDSQVNDHTNRGSDQDSHPLKLPIITHNMDVVTQLAVVLVETLQRGSVPPPRTESDSTNVERWLDIFMQSSPPKFAGSTNPLIVEEWLRQIKQIFEGIECPEEKRVTLVEFVLQKDVVAWWNNYMRIHLKEKKASVIAWSEFINGFLSGTGLCQPNKGCRSN
ncbi:hypothetical protein KSP39_PZI001269 [Platanthera zijinensis]|uniref:Retrotransposon gag domain-containing protein n=1 Tax=Platanthera zijinensis TaxID=2320716 RepID=A0AAP0C249_9ASPA